MSDELGHKFEGIDAFLQNIEQKGELTMQDLGREVFSIVKKEIRVYQDALPHSAPGFVIYEESGQGHFSICVNNLLSPYSQICTIGHEYGHILHGDVGPHNPNELEKVYADLRAGKKINQIKGVACKSGADEKLEKYLERFGWRISRKLVTEYELMLRGSLNLWFA